MPQCPDLFEGTIRQNIDPTGEHQDADIWVALQQVNLKGFVESFPEGLDAPVREGGSSMSAGQRQLLCFARALLRKVRLIDVVCVRVDLLLFSVEDTGLRRRSALSAKVDRL